MTRPVISLAVVLAVLLAALAGFATATAVATDSDDEQPAPPEQVGTIGGDVSAQGDTIGGLKVHNVDPTSFAPGSDANVRTLTSAGNCLRVDGNAYAPVDLPQGAEVTTVIAYVRDDSETGQVSIQLRKRDFGAGTTENLFVGATGGAETPGRTTLVLDDEGGNNSLDKNSASFLIRTLISDNSGDLQLCNVQVLYNVPASTGLEFASVTPCAVFDTRPGRGGIERKLDPGETITVDTIMGDYSSQGGSDGSCGIPSATGSSLFGDSESRTVSVALNLVALNPDGRGNLRAWKDGDPTPSGGVLIYPGENNNAIVPIEVKGGSAFGGNGGEITIQNNGNDTVHVRAVVVGYYTPVDSRW